MQNANSFPVSGNVQPTQQCMGLPAQSVSDRMKLPAPPLLAPPASVPPSYANFIPPAPLPSSMSPASTGSPAFVPPLPGAPAVPSFSSNVGSFPSAFPLRPNQNVAASNGGVYPTSTRVSQPYGERFPPPSSFALNEQRGTAAPVPRNLLGENYLKQQSLSEVPHSSSSHPVIDASAASLPQPPSNSKPSGFPSMPNGCSNNQSNFPPLPQPNQLHQSAYPTYRYGSPGNYPSQVAGLQQDFQQMVSS